nr:ROK family protein [Nakamurella alba]
MTGDRVVAVDIGGTSIKGAVAVRVDGGVELVGPSVRRATRAVDGPQAVLEAVLSVLTELQGQAPDVVAAGVGVAGTVDAAAGLVRFSANLGWRDLPLAGIAAQHTGLPIVLGHDVRSAALAEARLGAGRDENFVWFVSLGTGIAGGLITAGQVDPGATGQAGEFGHIVVDPGGDPCGCGNRGCLETLASASRVAARYRALTGVDTGAAEVAAAMRAGDAAAQQIWDDAAEALGAGLATVTALLDPGVVVLGGGLALAGDLLRDPVATALAQRLTFRRPPPVRVTTLGDQAGLLGVALAAFDDLDVDRSAPDPARGAAVGSDGSAADPATGAAVAAVGSAADPARGTADPAVGSAAEATS